MSVYVRIAPFGMVGGVHMREMELELISLALRVGASDGTE